MAVAMPKQANGAPPVCHCRKVSYEKVEDAIGRGAHSLADLQRQTTACTRCFGCRFELERMLQARLGDDYERSTFVTRPEDDGASGLRGWIARLLGRAGKGPALPKRMYMPVLEGFQGSVRTRVAIFHWREGSAAPISFRADLLALDGTRLAVREATVRPGETTVIETRQMLNDANAALPGGAGTLKVVLGAERLMSLRPYFHFITEGGITSTHEKSAPRLGRVPAPRSYHWTFPVGYSPRASEAYFFLTNTLADPIRDHALVWRSETGDERGVKLPTLELDQSACVPLHEELPAVAAGHEAGTVRLSHPTHVAGFILRRDAELDLWRVQHL